MSASKNSKWRGVLQRVSGATTIKNREEKRAIERLKLTAHSLLADVNNCQATATNLCAHAEQVPRPGTPPLRDPLFQRPGGAPPSEYEKRVKAYNAMVEQFTAVTGWIRELESKIANFKTDVKDIASNHKHGGKIGKTEHDIESLDNARRNLEVELGKLRGQVKTVKDIAAGSST